jgi:hypothetical protein
MKAMLEPRMVTVSIQALAFVPLGTPATPDRMTASSQGVLIELSLPA